MRLKPQTIVFGYASFLLLCGLIGLAFDEFALDGHIHGVRLAAVMIMLGIAAGRLERNRTLATLGIDLALVLMLLAGLNYARLGYKWSDAVADRWFDPWLAVLLAFGSLMACALLLRGRLRTPSSGSDWWGKTPLLGFPAILFAPSRRRYQLRFERRVLFAGGLGLFIVGIMISTFDRSPRQSLASALTAAQAMERHQSLVTDAAVRKESARLVRESLQARDPRTNELLKRVEQGDITDLERMLEAQALDDISQVLQEIAIALNNQPSIAPTPGPTLGTTPAPNLGNHVGSGGNQNPHPDPNPGSGAAGSGNSDASALPASSGSAHGVPVAGSPAAGSPASGQPNQACQPAPPISGGRMDPIFPQLLRPRTGPDAIDLQIPPGRVTGADASSNNRRFPAVTQQRRRTPAADEQPPIVDDAAHIARLEAVIDGVAAQNARRQDDLASLRSMVDEAARALKSADKPRKQTSSHPSANHKNDETSNRTHSEASGLSKSTIRDADADAQPARSAWLLHVAGLLCTVMGLIAIAIAIGRRPS